MTHCAHRPSPAASANAAPTRGDNLTAIYGRISEWHHFRSGFLGGVNLAAEYFVGLSIAHPAGNTRADLILRNHAVVEQPLGPLGLHVLLGRDVQDRCLTIYDGPGRVFTLAY